MKLIILSFVALLSFSCRAESDYLHSIEIIHAKMIEAKKAKDHIIRSTKGQSDVPRSQAIQNALSEYKEKMIPLMNEESSLRAKFYGKVSESEESLLKQKSKKLRKILQDESEMEEAAKEIDMTAYSN